MYRAFECFEPEVYYGIIASIIVISFVTSLYKQSLKSFFTTFWSYLSIIISDFHSNEKKVIFNKILSGVWLMVCLIFLSAFSGQLREQILRPRTIHWIDSWDDLYEWKDLNIQTFKTSLIKTFSDNNPNDTYSQEFNKRFEKIDDSVEGTWHFDVARVKAGELAVVYPYHALQIKKGTLGDFQEEVDFHISKYAQGESSDEMQAIFSLSNCQSLNETLTNIFDLV